MDVTPLLLAVLDLPLSEELPGRVPEEILTERFREQYPLRSTPAYDFEWTAVDAAVPDPKVDEARLEQLKALGYVGGSTQPGGRNVESELDFWSIERRLRQEALEGELLFYLMRGDTEAISGLMTLTRERDPELSRSLPNLVKSSAEHLQADFSYPIFDQSALRFFQETY